MTLSETIDLVDAPYVVWLDAWEADEIRRESGLTWFRRDALRPLVACRCCDRGRADPRDPLFDNEINACLAVLSEAW